VAQPSENAAEATPNDPQGEVMLTNDYRLIRCRHCGHEVLFVPGETRCLICDGELEELPDRRVLDFASEEEDFLETSGFWDASRGVYVFPDFPGLEVRPIGLEAMDLFVNGKQINSHVPAEVLVDWMAEHLE